MSIPFFVPTWIISVIPTDVTVVGKKMNIIYLIIRIDFSSGILLVITGILYFIKTFKYKRINTDEDDHLFDRSKSISRSSISTQTSVMGLNEDNLSSGFAMEQRK